MSRAWSATRSRPAGVKLPNRPPERLRARVKRYRERFLFNRELRLRLLSAAVLIPLVLGATWLGEGPFALVILGTGILVVVEWLRMVGAGSLIGVQALSGCSLGVVALAAATQPLAGTLPVLALAALVPALGVRGGAPPRWVIAGMLYAGAAVVALIALRRGGDGFGAVLFVFLVAWATDTAAFFVGRKLGGPRLWRRVSPSKTWSGAIGGLVAGTLVGVLVIALLGGPVTLAALGAAALVAVAAEAGDLVESAFKRRFAIKDAGTLIPGHGGVMDRVDGLVLAALVTVGLSSLVASETAAGGLFALLGR